MQPGADQVSTGPSLAELRNRAVLTQVELSAKSGLSVETISGIECGSHENGPRPSTIRALAEAIGVSPQMVADACAESRRRAQSGGVSHG